VAQDEFDKQTIDWVGDMDICDHTQKVEGQIMDMQIQAIRGAPRELEPVGVCYNCTTPVEGERLFCSGECATDYERRK
jgi:hypothetical protein